jgi:MamI-like restriction endonuclease
MDQKYSKPVTPVVEMSTPTGQAERDALELLDLHYAGFKGVLPYAEKYGHPHPTDTRGWSQIIVSALTGILGLKRKKGSDLEDGSDVKAANTWGAIDTPRFNGVLKSGTKGATAGTMASLDKTPHLFFVLWDHEPETKEERCRVWVVQTQNDPVFRKMARTWYKKRRSGEIISNNFQLHPPRNKNSNVFRNTCGNLEYPLLFEARRRATGFESTFYKATVLASGLCKEISEP